LSAVAASAVDLPVDQIVAKHVAAKGGIEAIHGITAVRVTGDYTAFGDSAPFTLVRTRPQLYRFDFKALGGDLTYAWDGEKAWWINVSMGYPWAVAPPLPERRFIHSEALFDNPLIDAAARGIELRAGGAGDLDGAPTVVVVAVLPDGSEERWHLDPGTWLEVKRESRGADFGREVPCITYFSDFRSVAGVMFPFRVEQEYSIRWRTFEIADIEVNPVVDPAVFRLPIEPALDRLAGLAGRWQVKYSSIPYPGAPAVETEAKSTIVERFDGRVFEETVEVVTATSAGVELRTWSWDRFRERYTAVMHDDTSAHAAIAWGTAAEDGAIVVDTLGSETAVVLGEQTLHSRYTLRRSGADAFELVAEVSNDGGTTWNPAYTAKYQRAQ
jgi:hypothetical protein